MSKLVLQSIAKTYSASGGQKVSAIRDLNLTIADELLVLVGPSGSGKTTILRLIAGLEQLDAGTISLDGVVLNNVPAKNRDIAMMFQSPALFPHLTSYENISFGLKLRGVAKPEIDKRVNAAADTLNLREKLSRRPHELSGGEAQRVALARAIVREPKIFLLDEPLSSVDAPTRKQLRAEIVCLQQRLAVPMVYVTHDQREALALGGRVAVIRGGQLQQIGTAADIQSTPANQFVSEFFDPTL
jgi:multiple sugar transport system ATP-binding protein